MKRIIMTSSVVALGLVISSTALAANKGHGPGPGNRVSAASGVSAKGGQNQAGQRVGGQNGGSSSGSTKKVGTGTQSSNQSGPAQSQSNKKVADNGSKGPKSNGSTMAGNHKVQYTVKEHVEFKNFHGHCYPGREFRFWSHCCFDARYGCDIYYCPIRTCWYFWFEPWDCYLPCDYWVNVCHL